MSVVLRSSAAREFGRYELLEFLGSGGMSDVFVAVHTGLRKRMALKLLRPHLRGDALSVRRFLREGECAARVSHPHVVHVTDVGTEQGAPFLVMELLTGESLEEKLEREGPLSLSVAVDLVLQVLEGVRAIHEAGVLHRDLKPGNIFLARMKDGSVIPKVVDFGIATLAERGSVTGEVGPIGTPHYMSPEQARGNPIDQRTDLYSVASMLFEMVTGRMPWGDGDVEQVIERLKEGRFPRPSDVRENLPPALDEVMARATHPRPERRYGSVDELAQALLPFAGPRSRRRWAPRGSALPFGPGWDGEDDPHATARIQVTPLPRTSRPSVRRLSRSRSWLRPAGLALVAALLALALRADLFDTGAPLTSTAAVGAAAPRTEELRSKQPLAPSTQRLLALSPAHAQATLDGKPLGQGFVTLPEFRDDAVHELRVTAPQHVTRVLLFRRSLDSARIVLEPLRPARAATRADAQPAAR
jgi:serine/threonine protein kinase